MVTKEEQITEEMIKFAVKQMGNDATEKEKEDQRQFLTKVFIDKQSPWVAIGFEEKMIDSCYGYAVSLYDAGQFDEAEGIFRWLQTLDPSDYRFSFGTAACWHLMDLQPIAIEMYMCSGLQNLVKPEPFYHMADCYITLKKWMPACLALGEAIKRCGFNPGYALIKQRSIMIRRVLCKNLGISPQFTDEGQTFVSKQEEPVDRKSVV